MAGKPTVNDIKSGASERPGRERSTIEFPYGDLGDAVQIARSIHENAGTSCSPEQLAGYMSQTISSGAFRLKIATARIFGLVETSRGDVSLTSLGRQIVDAGQEKNARSNAFLAVPLYRAIYDKFKGHLLPPPAALEREMANLGVSSKQTDKARQAFERSAEAAGFFAHGSDRLTMPAGASRSDSAPIARAEVSPSKIGGSSGGNGGGRDVDPIIRGLVDRLPSPDSEWPIADRAKWLQTVAGAFGLVYQAPNGDNGEIVITLKSPDR